jgi:ABC-type transport system involved in multi-copper enzyme maturation permease subunit
MNRDVTFGSIVRSEWLKFRSVRSSITGVVVTFVLTIGLAALITSVIRTHWSTTSLASKATFDPVSSSLVGVILAEFAVGVIGALFVTSEYSSGSMRTTLTAVPKRIELTLAKLFVLVVSMLVVGEVACFASFLLGQSIYSGVVPTASLSNGPTLHAVIMAGVYLTLLATLAFGLGLIIRHSAATISVFVGILLILPLIFAFFPQSWRNAGQKYLPSELGRAMTSPSAVSHDFGAWTALILMVVYVVVIAAIGAVLFNRRDA